MTDFYLNSVRQKKKEVVEFLLYQSTYNSHIHGLCQACYEKEYEERQYRTSTEYGVFLNGHKLPLSFVEYEELILESMQKPVRIAERDGSCAYWLYQNKIYVDEDDLDQSEALALLWAARRRKERKIKRAVALMAQEEIEYGNRERLSDDVKLFVWNRDNAKCVKCGSQEKLEFDDIIPFSKGGSNTARNIQLLCETCNREKGDSLV